MENLKGIAEILDSKKTEDIVIVYKACWDYVAQHRAVIKLTKGGFVTGKELKRRDKKK